MTGIRALGTIFLSIVELRQPEHGPIPSEAAPRPALRGGDFSTDCEESLSGAEPPGRLLKKKKNQAIRTFEHIGPCGTDMQKNKILEFVLNAESEWDRRHLRPIH